MIDRKESREGVAESSELLGVEFLYSLQGVETSEAGARWKGDIEINGQPPIQVELETRHKRSNNFLGGFGKRSKISLRTESNYEKWELIEWSDGLHVALGETETGTILDPTYKTGFRLIRSGPVLNFKQEKSRPGRILKSDIDEQKIDEQAKHLMESLANLAQAIRAASLKPTSTP